MYCLRIAPLMNIQPIVEGHGEVAAVPVLLRRFRDEAQAWQVNIGRPIRRPRGQLVQQTQLEQAVNLALRQPGCDAILIMFDGDTDCPAELGPKVHRWATVAAGDVPCEVVLPHREYEAWFLAAIESLRGVRDVKSDAQPHPNPEAPSGAKEQLEARLKSDKSYFPNKDQAAFSAQFSMAAAHARCRSFRKLTRSFGNLLCAMGQNVDPWPPASWQANP